jgi:hypothetical protein
MGEALDLWMDKLVTNWFCPWGEEALEGGQALLSNVRVHDTNSGK